MRIAAKLASYSLGLLALGVLVIPMTASAYITGQPGASGRFGQKCADCHGPTQYDGVTIRLPADNTSECFVDTDEGFKKSAVWTGQFGQAVAATIVVTKPEGEFVPQCPTKDPCCDGGLEEISPQVSCSAQSDCGDGEACWDFVNDTVVAVGGTGTCGSEILCPANTDCRAGVDSCGDMLVGFDAELVGGGSWSPGEGSRVRVTQAEPASSCTADADCGGGKVCWDFSSQQPSTDGLCGIAHTNEVVHSSPKSFAGEEATWDVTLTFPTEEETNAENPAVEVWIGANIANGNGLPDLNDVNGNFLATIQMGGSGLPSYCAQCDEGFEFDEEGNCVGPGGCGCSQGADSDLPLSGLAAFAGLFGLALWRRRRR
jgi:MYXO-CTERM domain-containing protein